METNVTWTRGVMDATCFQGHKLSHDFGTWMQLACLSLASTKTVLIMQAQKCIYIKDNNRALAK